MQVTAKELAFPFDPLIHIMPCVNLLDLTNRSPLEIAVVLLQTGMTGRWTVPVFANP